MDAYDRLTKSSLTVRRLSEISLPIKIALVAIPSLFIFFQDVYTIGAEAFASDYFNYVLVLPFLIGYLIYTKRKVLAAVLPLKDDNGRGYLNPVVGCCGLVSSLMLYVYGTYTSYILDYHLLALEIFLGSSILLIFNRETLRILAVPILLISTALPSAVAFGLSFWYILSWYSLFPAYLILRLFGLRVTLVTSINAPIVQLTATSGQTFQFAVGVASSGIYSFVGFTVFALFVAYIAKGALWKRVLLFAIGYVLLIPINISREVILVLAANYYGLAAFDFSHLTSGIVLVAIVTFVLLVIGDRFFGLVFFYSAKPKPSCSQCASEFFKNHGFCSNCGKFLRSVKSGFSTREIIFAEVLVVMAIIFYASIAPPVVSAASSPSNVPLNNITSQNALTFLPKIPGWNLTYLGPDISVQEQLGQDATLSYQYVSQNALNSSLDVTILSSVQISPTYHTPETSVIQHPINYGLQLEKVYVDAPVQILDNPPLVGQYFVFQNGGSGNQTEAILYWNIRALFNLGSYSDYRNLQVWVVAFTQSLVQEGAISNASNFSGTEQILLPLAQATAKYWSPESTNSLLQSSLKQLSLPIAGIAVLPAVFVTGLSSYDMSKIKRANGKSSGQLRSDDDRKILESLKHLSMGRRQGCGTLDKITEEFKVLTGREITPGEVSLSLSYLEHLGFIGRKVIDAYGEPMLIWTSRV